MKLYMFCEELCRPLTFFLSPGQMSDVKVALVLLSALPPAKRLLADRGYDADWFREALESRGIAAWARLRNMASFRLHNRGSVRGVAGILYSDMSMAGRTTMTTVLFAGLDVSLELTSICVVDEDGRTIL
mgnify:FL=1